jgi:hypothetical protein
VSSSPGHTFLRCSFEAAQIDVNEVRLSNCPLLHACPSSGLVLLLRDETGLLVSFVLTLFAIPLLKSSPHLLSFPFDFLYQRRVVLVGN